MPVAQIETQNEVFTVYSGVAGYQAISNLGTKTPIFRSIERLQDYLEKNSRIQKTFSRV
jgi:hypothetical protein